jgi:hypothetical protein
VGKRRRVVAHLAQKRDLIFSSAQESIRSSYVPLIYICVLFRSYPVLPQVWFAHKRVCGIYPFRQPPLSPEECAAADTLYREAQNTVFRDPGQELLLSGFAAAGKSRKVSLPSFLSPHSPR